MCCSSLTTSSVSLRPALRCLPFLAAFPLLSVTSPLLLPIWVPSRSALPPPRTVPSLPSRLSTCLLMILPIRLPPPPSLTLTPPLCCLVLLPSSVSTPLSTRLTPSRVCLTPPSSVTSTTTPHDLLSRSSRTTSRSPTLLLSLVWTSSLRRTSSPLPVPVRCSVSCLSPSPSLRSSLASRVSSLTLKPPSTTSTPSSTASTMTSQKVPSCSRVTCRPSRTPPARWLPTLPSLRVVCLRTLLVTKCPLSSAASRPCTISTMPATPSTTPRPSLLPSCRRPGTSPPPSTGLTKTSACAASGLAALMPTARSPARPRRSFSRSSAKRSTSGRCARICC
mmetsp:Transcript_54189/g.80459  ORF Transcript_54189/g.80459 Transcript_54189/m.80459 type:complete len:335 (-) Transcript_54189:314-1318(-)